MKFLLLALISLNSVFAATYYVDSSVTSSGVGTSWGTAFKTVNAALSGRSPGDIILVSGGTYTDGTLTPPNGSLGSPIIIRAASDVGHTGMVIFDGQGSNTTLLFGNLQYVTLDGYIGGVRRFIATNYTQNIAVCDNSTGVALRGIVGQRQIRLYGSTQYEVGWCTISPEIGLDVLIGLSSALDETTYGVNSIHDCILNPLRLNDTTGYGDDGIQWGAGLDVYNNIITGTPWAGYNLGQHQDGMQTSGNFLRVYNNQFVNCGNTGFFGEFAGPDQHDVMIYNNLVYCTDVSLLGICRGIEVGTRSTVDTFQRVRIMNNTVVDISNHSGIRFLHDVTNTVWSSNLLANNLVYNCGGGGTSAIITETNGVTVAYNVAVSGAHGGSFIFPDQTPGPASTTFTFNTYSEYGSGNNYSIQASLPGEDLSAYFTTDRVGATRSDWTIGAYEFTAAEQGDGGSGATGSAFTSGSVTIRGGVILR